VNNVFINTENVTKCMDICAEMESPDSLIGPSLGMITGSAGRGKSEFAKHYATNSNAIYLPPMNKRSTLMLLREVTFELCETKLGRIEYSLDLISREMGKERRLIIIDEADLLAIDILEMLRNVNERCNCPILLIGEEGLKGKVASRRRISSRIRRKAEFGPVTQPDIVLFFRKALNQAVSPASSAMIHKYSNGDWRPVLTTAIDLERAMKASGLKEITENLVKGIINKNA